MAAKKPLRLGRGLDSLISGGLGAQPPAATPPGRTPAATTAARGLKKRPAAPAARTGKPAAPAARHAAKPAAKPAPPANPAAAAEPGMQEIPLARVVPNPRQPRGDFAEDTLRELADSIRAEGLLQPIVVRPRADGAGYELIAGERRWRACRMLGLKRIPARVLQVSDTASAVLSLIENLQRDNLNPVEEALGYASLIRDFSLTQEAVAERVGKARASVANALRLLQLEKEIQGYLAKALLSTGHAKVLLAVEAGAARLLLARQSIEKGWSVREIEHQVRLAQSRTRPGAGTARSVPAVEAAAIHDLEKQLATVLATRVRLRHTAKKGSIIIEYHGNEDLQRIIEKMGLH
jgi:ParB family chromosome partitioning protein